MDHVVVCANVKGVELKAQHRFVQRLSGGDGGDDDDNDDDDDDDDDVQIFGFWDFGTCTPLRLEI